MTTAAVSDGTAKAEPGVCEWLAVWAETNIEPHTSGSCIVVAAGGAIAGAVAACGYSAAYAPGLPGNSPVVAMGIAI